MFVNHIYRALNNVKQSLLLVLLAFSGLYVQAQQAGDLYKNAAALYKANQFEQAAAAYEKIAGQGYKNADVYYNLGNCYYKLNNISKAIINYERALKLQPQDEDAQHNLAIANAHIVDKIQPVPTLGIINAWNSFTSTASSAGWAYVAIGILWLALLLMAVYLFAWRSRVPFVFGLILVLISISALGIAAKENNLEQQNDYAVLTVPNSFVKSAPDANGNDVFMLHEGVKFRILDRVGEWGKLKLADGKVGWIERSHYEKI